MLLGGGVGLPIPEDITLLTFGYLSAQGLADMRIGIVVALLSVMLADSALFLTGRRHGRRALHSHRMSRFITPARIRRAEVAFDRHGGKVLFAARFLPVVRAVFFFSAGACAVPFWRLLAFDGSAALIHVPAIILLGWCFSGHIDAVRHWERSVQLLLIAGAVLCVIVVVLVRRRKGQRDNPSAPS